MTIRVLLADDKALLRATFRLLIDSVPDMDVAGEAANGREAVVMTRSQRADGRSRPGSAADAVADVRGLRRASHWDDLQLDARRQHFEQLAAATEQRDTSGRS